jgi:hypothetical protein
VRSPNPVSPCYCTEEWGHTFAVLHCTAMRARGGIEEGIEGLPQNTYSGPEPHGHRS